MRRSSREISRSLTFPPASFAAVVALYSISHVPREEHAAVLANVFSWLVPGGVFVVTLGAGDSPDWIGEWLGVPMFFSGWGVDESRSLVLDAGFEIVRSEVVEIREPEGPVAFLWMLARKPD